MASINGNKINNARLVDPKILLQAGINPKTGMPAKLGADDEYLQQGIKHVLRIQDEQDAITRYKWYNLPSGITSELLERILYYRGQGMFFYMDADEKFYFLPYTLAGSIDVYGRFTEVTPLPFNGPTKDDKQNPWIVGLTKKPVYDEHEEITLDTFMNGCVLLKDYTPQVSETNVSRQILNDPILEAMSEAFPFARTALIANTGIMGVRVDGEEDQTNVELASRSVTHAAKTGKPWIPIVGHVEMQELTASSAYNSEQYLMYMQSLDNFRRSLYGLENGGIFEKKAHILQSENAMNVRKTQSALQNGLNLRQQFCMMVNMIWGLGIWCETSETAMGDKDYNGVAEDNQDYNGVAEDDQMNDQVQEGEE